MLDCHKAQEDKTLRIKDTSGLHLNRVRPSHSFTPSPSPPRIESPLAPGTNHSSQFYFIVWIRMNLLLLLGGLLLGGLLLLLLLLMLLVCGLLLLLLLGGSCCRLTFRPPPFSQVNCNSNF